MILAKFHYVELWSLPRIRQLRTFLWTTRFLGVAFLFTEWREVFPVDPPITNRVLTEQETHQHESEKCWSCGTNWLAQMHKRRRLLFLPGFKTAWRIWRAPSRRFSTVRAASRKSSRYDI